MKRYSIRTLLLVTLLTAVFMAGPLHRARLQREAREWVATQRGHSFFKYSYASDTQRIGTGSNVFVPGFVVRLLGVDTFNPVEAVVFDCDELTTLEPLVGMKSLRSIEVNIEMADDIDFPPLTELPRLRSIHFTKWSLLSESQLSEVRTLLPDVNIHSDVHSNTVTSGK